MELAVANYNLAAQSNFKLEIPDAPNINYFLQSCTLPSVMMSGVETPFTNNQAVMPGNAVDFSSLNVVALMDEDFTNYLFMHTWLRSFIDDDVWRNLTKDIKLHIVSAEKTSLLIFTFVQAFPVSLGEVQFDSSVMDSMQILFNVEIRYEYFTWKITKLSL